MYILLFSVLFTINVGIDTYFGYYKYMNRNEETASKYGYVYQTTISLINNLIKWERSNK